MPRKTPKPTRQKPVSPEEKKILAGTLLDAIHIEAERKARSHMEGINALAKEIAAWCKQHSTDKVYNAADWTVILRRAALLLTDRRKDVQPHRRLAARIRVQDGKVHCRG